FLCCLSTSRSSTDKLAFDVGLQEETTGTGQMDGWMEQVLNKHSVFHIPHRTSVLNSIDDDLDF
ncbi:hypothetical protein GOODEAATRI_032523, partial [Goodea atripinnis]